MAKYRTEKGIVNTDKAILEYSLDQWDGHNITCGGTGLHQTLYRSKKGQWYILHSSQWQGSKPRIEFIEENTAYKRLATMGEAPANKIINEYFSEKFIAERESEEI